LKQILSCNECGFRAVPCVIPHYVWLGRLWLCHSFWISKTEAFRTVVPRIALHASFETHFGRIRVRISRSISRQTGIATSACFRNHTCFTIPKSVFDSTASSPVERQLGGVTMASDRIGFQSESDSSDVPAMIEPATSDGKEQSADYLCISRWIPGGVLQMRSPGNTGNPLSASDCEPSYTRNPVRVWIVNPTF
jgi:hypothetical protein